MVNKSYTQFGKFSVAIMLPLLVISVILLIIIGLEDVSTAIIFSIIVLTLLICLLIFYKLTINIDGSSVSFRMGIGMVSRKYLISDIESCKPIKNSMLTGIGIRLLPNGWLYNVSGLYSIELKLKNRKSIVRIGTDQPEVIAAEINKLIEGNKSASSFVYSEKSYAALILVFFLLVMILPVVIILTGKREMKTTFTDTEFIISGMYGLSIKLADIKQLDTISALPSISRRTNGYAAGKTLKGNFTLTDRSKVKLFITKGIPPYIIIRTDDLLLYMNYKERVNTIQVYNELKEKSTE